jgi:spore coat protein A
MSQGNLSRRGLLRGALAVGGSGFVLAATGGEVIAASSKLASKNTPVPFANLFRRPPVLMPTETGVDEQGKFAKYRIAEKLGQQSIVPGLLTTVAAYNGMFPGPTIRVSQGTRHRGADGEHATKC